MIDIFRRWVARYLAHEEAVALLAVMLLSIATVLLIGDIMAPVIAGVIIAFLLQGLVTALQRRRIPARIAMLIAFVAFLGGAVAVVLFVMPLLWNQLTNFFREMPTMLVRGELLLDQLVARYPQVFTETQVNQWMGIAQEQLAGLGQRIISASLGSIPGIVALLIYVVLIPMLVFFLLKDHEQILRWFVEFLPAERPLMRTVWVEMNRQFANYVRGKFIEIVVVAVASYVAFAVMGLNYAVLLGVLVGLSVVIPYIGAAVVTIPVALVAFFQFGWNDGFFYLMLVYAIIQVIDGYVIVPLLFSGVVNLHPVAIMVAVLFFGGIWGFWGVFFAIPLATLLNALLHAWPRGLKTSVDT
jgi:putative permease